MENYRFFIISIENCRVCITLILKTLNLDIIKQRHQKFQPYTLTNDYLRFA